jgi:peptidoglycan/xylan/chitin deacetylase (PgdA/CDA1 family)
MDQLELVFKASKVFRRTRITDLLMPIYSGVGAIFLLHRVTADQHSELDDMFTTASFLDTYISFLKKNNIDIISLDQMFDRLSTSCGKSRNFVVFTFDDGYKDNLTQALPIFEKHRVPFTIYVTQNLIEKKILYWWRGVETIFKEKSHLLFQHHGNNFNYENFDYETKKKNYRHFMRFAHRYKIDINQETEIDRLFAKFNIDIKELLDKESLTPNEIKSLSQSDLVTIGSHTVNHLKLRYLEEQVAYHEMLDSKKYLEDLLGQKVLHFAYPFGDRMTVSKREFQLAEKAGFLTSTTTRSGTLRKDHKYHLHALPRLSFSGRYESIEFMEFFRAGIPHQIKNKSILPVSIID